MSRTIGEAIKLAYEHEGKINDILNNYMTTDTPQTVTGAKYFPNGKAMFENYIIASGYTISFPQRNGEIALASDIDSIRANYVAWIQGIPSVTHGSEIVSYVFNVYNNRNQGFQNILQNFSFTLVSATVLQAGLMSAADKVKVNNIANDIATALSTAKTYTDGKTERTYLVNTIGEATTSQSGLLSAADKTKINNIAGDISTALNAAKTYTDSKVARENLVAVLGEATTTLNGLMSATDKERLNTLYALLGESDDPDQFVNTISEILEVFETYPEGADIATVLAGKINYSDVVDNLNSNETVKPLSANQGRILKSMVDQKVFSYSNDSTQWDTAPTSGSTKPVTSGGVKAADDALVADIGNLETAVSALETGKADKSDTFNKTEIEGFLAAKADKATTYTKDEDDALLAGKQDTLVSGENIKTINGTSLLGSGDYDFDTALNEASTNAVQNKVITEYITDLESKVSTLAVKVYNHDIALGTLNIENTLYSVENADSFAIPTTIGTNADVVIPKSRMALSAVKGKTEYSRNMFRLFDTEEKSVTYNGLNFVKSKDGFITIKGTTTSQINNSLFTILGYDRQTLEQGKTYSYKIEASGTYDDGMLFSFDGYDAHYLKNLTNGVKQVTFTCNNENVYDAIHMYAGVNEVVDVKFRIMLVKGSTALPYVPYYTGLKNVELNSLNVYGKTDNYTDLNVGDKVRWVHVSYNGSGLYSSQCRLLDDDGTIYRIYIDYDNRQLLLRKYTDYDNNVYSTRRFNVGLTDIDLDLTLEVNAIESTYSSDNLKSATSVKSILPSSILPKTLPAYERLEVVDNGDGTYKIDLVSHAELHVGDEINSLWVGNPQTERIGADASFLKFSYNDELYNAFRTRAGADSTNIYNRIYCHGTTNAMFLNLINNYDELCGGSNPLFGGWDNYVSGVDTNRNCIVKLSDSITIYSLPNYDGFSFDFRNGEETRTTLVSGLSLDDISAVIDTGDIVYADNSNAEYDVNIDGTSVELLVNKAN